ncbi:hypothetical protein VTN31DRAFT_673 [Thermomyces dupontii]|uniref:uncharacterized protein n=1 Tax=Talaromyces thermophilus TaxID=28565 RepID=UPI003742AB81
MVNPYEERPLLDRLLRSPLTYFIHPIHILLLRLRGTPHTPPPHRTSIRVVCISDTHTLRWQDVPDGDLLVHAGDLSNDGSVREIQSTVDWLKSLPHRYKVVVSGNHDSYFDVRSRREEDRDHDHSLGTVSASTASIRSVTLDDDPGLGRIDWGDDVHYLQHSSVSLTFPGSGPGESSRTLNIYGAPQIPEAMPLGPEHAFTYPPEQDAWSGTIPIETDVLVTHTPPFAHRDLGPNFGVGCPFLLSEVWRVRPVLHIFGHVHAAYGSEPVFWDEAQKAWERLCLRASRRGGPVWLGAFQDLISPRSWIDAVRVVFYGVVGVIWARVWGGSYRGSGWMVNAACMYRSSGELRNPPQVFII